jgi:hypothetical protein
MSNGWNVYEVSGSQTNPPHTWNTIDGQAYPFLSRQSVS